MRRSFLGGLIGRVGAPDRVLFFGGALSDKSDGSDRSDKSDGLGVSPA